MSVKGTEYTNNAEENIAAVTTGANCMKVPKYLSISFTNIETIASGSLWKFRVIAI